MQAIAKEIHESETLVNVEDRIVAVNEIFRLQDADEYSAAERLYLSASNAARSAVVLAASRGAGLEAVTADRPKVMLPIAGKPLLRWLVDGFKKETSTTSRSSAAIAPTRSIRRASGSWSTSARADGRACVAGLRGRNRSIGDTVISYGDLLFRSYVLRDLVESDSDFCVVVDSSQAPQAGETATDFAYCSRRRRSRAFRTQVWLEGVVSTASSAAGKAGSPQGRWMGLLNVRGAARERLRATLARLQQRDDFDTLDMPALLNALVDAGERIEVQYVHGHWRGVNDLDDFRRAVDFAHAQAPYGSSGATSGGGA